MRSNTNRLYDAARKITDHFRAKGNPLCFSPMGADHGNCGTLLGYFQSAIDAQAKIPISQQTDLLPNCFLAGPNDDGTFGVMAPTALQKECFQVLGQKWSDPTE